MSASTAIGPELRPGLLTLWGTALMIAPLVLELGVAAILTGGLAGVATVALGLAGTEREGRGTLPPDVQADYVQGIALGLLATALVFGLADDLTALAVFGIAGIAGLLVTALTSASPEPA
jgi:hypothetical protein